MELMAWLLHPKPEQRATIADVDRDPWVWQDIDIDEYRWEDVLPNSGRCVCVCACVCLCVCVCVVTLTGRVCVRVCAVGSR